MVFNSKINFNKFKLFVLILFCGILFLIIKIFLNNKNSKIANKQINQSSFYLINVLDKEEFDDAHINKSINVPFEDIDKFLKSIEDKDSIIVFYCSNYICMSSHIAARNAIKKGFKNIFVYSGGIAEWFQKGKIDSRFKINGSLKMPYLNIIIPKINKLDDFPEIQAEERIINKNKREPIDLDADELLKLIKENDLF